MRASGAPSRRRGLRSSTGEHICQLDLRGIADYRSLSVGCATLNNLRCWKDIHLHMIGKNIANPIDKDDIIGDAKQIQLTNMRASAVELRARGKELHCTGEHICQLDLRGIADYRSLSIGFATLDNLRRWKVIHLHTIDKSVQVKYKGNIRLTP